MQYTKNTAVAGIAVLLCTALVFLGCEEASSSSGTAAPAAPEVTAEPADGQVTLSWQAVSGATSYKVFQGTNDNEVQNIAEGTVTAVITGLNNGQTYKFWVAAVNSGGSTLSAEVTATPIPPAVAGLTATAGIAQVVLTWTASTNTGVTGYKIRQTVDGTETEIDVSGMTTASHTVTGLAAGKSYTFTIAAVEGSAESTPSSAVTTTVIACNFTDSDGDGLIEICTLDHLAQINTDATTRSGDYELVRNLDFSSANSYAPGSANWSDKTWRPVNTSTAAASSTVAGHGSALNAGWAPIGPDADNQFTGSFNGRGYRIDNLYVRNRVNAGMFGYIASGGVIRNVHVHANIYGTAGSDQVGSIAGVNRGLIIASSSSGTGDSLADGNEYVGGLVGLNNGTIAASYSTASMNGGATAFDHAGGLVGDNNNDGTIASSYATGTADGGAGASDRVGGLTGRNFTSGTVIASYATGAVSNAGTNAGGSLIGQNLGTVTESYGYGAVGGSGGTPNGEKALTAGAAADGSTNAGTSWKTNVWDFGTSSQSPRLKWVTGYAAGTFTCDAALLPAGQSCGGIIPGQPAR